MIVICDRTHLHVTEFYGHFYSKLDKMDKDFFLLDLLDLSAPAGQTKECRFLGLCLGIGLIFFLELEAPPIFMYSQ